MALLRRLRPAHVPAPADGTLLAALGRSAAHLADLVGTGDPTPRTGDDDEGFALRLDPAPTREVRPHLALAAALTGLPAAGRAGTTDLTSAWIATRLGAELRRRPRLGARVRVRPRRRAGDPARGEAPGDRRRRPARLPGDRGPRARRRAGRRARRRRPRPRRRPGHRQLLRPPGVAHRAPQHPRARHGRRRRRRPVGDGRAVPLDRARDGPRARRRPARRPRRRRARRLPAPADPGDPPPRRRRPAGRRRGARGGRAQRGVSRPDHLAAAPGPHGGRRAPTAPSWPAATAGRSSGSPPPRRRR